MKKMHAVFALLAVFCLIPMQYAYAEGLYGGIGFGRSSTDLDTSDARRAQQDLQSLGVTATLDVDQKDTGKKLFVGYLINPHFAIEGEYVDFGKSTLSLSASKGTLHSQADADFRAKGFGVSAVGFIPVGDIISLIVKGGIFHSTADTNESYSSNLGDEQWSDSERVAKTHPFLGLGAQVAVTKTFSVRLEHEFFPNIGDEEKTGETDIGLTTIALIFNF